MPLHLSSFDCVVPPPPPTPPYSPLPNQVTIVQFHHHDQEADFRIHDEEIFDHGHYVACSHDGVPDKAAIDQHAFCRFK